MPDAVYVHDAFARIADRYVLTNHVLSCGMDIWWRKVVTARIRKWKPARLLDVASGTGDLALEIQDECPRCEVIASDFCAGWLTGQKDAYEYLGGSIEQFPSGKAMTDLLETCGFGQTDCTPVTLGVVTIYEGTR